MSLPKDNRDNEIAPAIYNGTSNFFDPNLSHNFPIIKVPTMAPTCSTIKNTKLEFSSYPARIIKFGSHVFKPKIINKQNELSIPILCYIFIMTCIRQIGLSSLVLLHLD